MRVLFRFDRVPSRSLNRETGYKLLECVSLIGGRKGGQALGLYVTDRDRVLLFGIYFFVRM